MEDEYGYVNEDYDLFTTKDIHKIISRQIKEERHKLEPERYIPLKPKPKKEKTEEECLNELKSSDLKFAFSAKELFYGYKKTISLTQYKAMGYKSRDEKEEILGNVFTDFIFFIIKNIILYNITFKFPSVGGFADIHMRTIEGEEFKKYRQKGKYLDINFLASNFKAYRPTLYRYDRQDSTKFWTTDIILDKNFQKELTQLINQEKQYYDSTPKGLDDYIMQFQQLYPNIKLDLLISIIKYGCRQIYYHAKKFRDVFIKSKTHYIYIGNIESYCGNKPQVYYGRQMRKKLEKLFVTKNIKWDGYYYFCLSKGEYKYYFRPTLKMKKIMRMNGSRALNTKYFFFNYGKVLFKHPDIAYVYYRNSKYMVRVKATQDYGNHRYIRPYIPLIKVENYEYVGKNTIETLMKHKYKILCQRKQR